MAQIRKRLLEVYILKSKYKTEQALENPLYILPKEAP
jgi:hypothetical protein